MSTQDTSQERCARCRKEAPPQDSDAFQDWEALGQDGEAVVCPDCITDAEQQGMDEDMILLSETGTRSGQPSRATAGMERIELFIDDLGDVAFTGREIATTDGMRGYGGTMCWTAYLTSQHRIAIYNDKTQRLDQYDSIAELANEGSSEFVGSSQSSMVRSTRFAIRGVRCRLRRGRG